MSTRERRQRYAPVSAGARVFGLLVLAPAVGVSQDYPTILSATLLAAVWMGCVFVEGLPRIDAMVALVVEACLVALVVGLALESSSVLLPALAVPAFVGGLVRGLRGTFEVIGAELVIVVCIAAASAEVSVDGRTAGEIFSALVAGLGLGSAAAYFHRTRGHEPSTASSYRDARSLLVELRDLSGQLVDGLDPVRISEGILDLAREELPLTGAVVYAESPRGHVPLVEGDIADTGADNSHVLDEVFRTGHPVLDGPWVGVPLRTEAGVVAALAGAVMPAARKDPVALRQTLDHLVENLGTEALQLDTALLFSSLRDTATAEERRRLARELHDGVAQDLASFGYLIDDITATAASPELEAKSVALRAELSRVVAELRRSVFQLRNEAAAADTLGESVRALAGHISARTGIDVEVSLHEGSRRLRPDVEAELLRITQEGMNNAVRHAEAHRIAVDIVVQAPEARIRVVDDGKGLQPGRDDSHGLRIMRERARRIGATLELRSPTDHPGTELRVELEKSPASGPALREAHR